MGAEVEMLVDDVVTVIEVVVRSETGPQEGQGEGSQGERAEGSARARLPGALRPRLLNDPSS